MGHTSIVARRQTTAEDIGEAVVVQWGARRHGNPGTYGTDGNVVAVSYRIYRR